MSGADLRIGAERTGAVLCIADAGIRVDAAVRQLVAERSHGPEHEALQLGKLGKRGKVARFPSFLVKRIRQKTRAPAARLHSLEHRIAVQQHAGAAQLLAALLFDLGPPAT
mgnify:CR=1 FL=1